MNKDLTKLSPGERLWAWRKENGLTGHQAAHTLGVGRGLYWEAEAGRRELPVPYVGQSYPELPTLLLLARKRSGWGLEGTARKLKTTHPTLLAWERAGAENLRKWWEKRGFLFVRP